MKRVSDIMLRAYLDGEADESDARKIELALQTNQSARATAKRMRRSKAILSEALSEEFQPNDELRAKLKAMAEEIDQSAESPISTTEPLITPVETIDSAKRHRGFSNLSKAANTNRFRGLMAVAACIGLVLIASEDKVQEYLSGSKNLIEVGDVKLRSAQVSKGHNEEIDFGVIVPKEIATFRALLFRNNFKKTTNGKIYDYNNGEIIKVRYSDKIILYFEAKKAAKIGLFLEVEDGSKIPIIEEKTLEVGEVAKSSEILAEPPAAAGYLLLQIQPQSGAKILSRIPIEIVSE
jgi:hypothetical protein